MFQAKPVRAPLQFSSWAIVAGAIGIAACDVQSRPTPAANSTEKSDVLEDQVCKIVATQVGVDRSKVNPGTSLADLHIDELDFVEIVMELEDHFQITIPDEIATGMTGTQEWQEGSRKLTIAKLIDIVNETRRQGKSNGSGNAPSSPIFVEDAK